MIIAENTFSNRHSELHHTEIKQSYVLIQCVFVLKNCNLLYLCQTHVTLSRPKLSDFVFFSSDMSSNYLPHPYTRPTLICCKQYSKCTLCLALLLKVFFSLLMLCELQSRPFSGIDMQM